MSLAFDNWHDAHAEAARRADTSGLDLAIRRVVELGRVRYAVSYAAVNDSDYALAEIVPPRVRSAAAQKLAA